MKYQKRWILKKKVIADIEVPIGKVVTVEESEERTKNKGNDDSDFDRIFGSASEDEVSNDMVKSMVVIRSKIKGGGGVSPKKWKSKGLLVKKTVSTTKEKGKEKKQRVPRDQVPVQVCQDFQSPWDLS